MFPWHNYNFFFFRAIQWHEGLSIPNVLAPRCTNCQLNSAVLNSVSERSAMGMMLWVSRRAATSRAGQSGWLWHHWRNWGCIFSHGPRVSRVVCQILSAKSTWERFATTTKTPEEILAFNENAEVFSFMNTPRSYQFSWVYFTFFQ